MPKILIVYWSGSGNTEKMAHQIEEGIFAGGGECDCVHVSSISPDILDTYDVLVFGSPAMAAGVVEETEMQPFLNASAPRLNGKTTILFGSYGWGEGDWMRSWGDWMRKQGARLVDDGLIVKETPEGAEAERCIAYGREIARVTMV